MVQDDRTMTGTWRHGNTIEMIWMTFGFRCRGIFHDSERSEGTRAEERCSTAGLVSD